MPVSKTKMKNAVIAARMAALPSIPKELIDQFVTGPMTGEAVNEVLAGRVQAVISSSIGVIGLQNDARVKSLASTGKRRSPFLPNLPTVEESGLPGYEFDSWIGLLAPAGTPKAEVDRLNAAVTRVMGEPAMKERFARLGVEPRTSSAEDFQKLLRAHYDTMGAVVKASGARID